MLLLDEFDTWHIACKLATRSFVVAWRNDSSKAQSGPTHGTKLARSAAACGVESLGGGGVELRCSTSCSGSAPKQRQLRALLQQPPSQGMAIQLLVVGPALLSTELSKLRRRGFIERTLGCTLSSAHALTGATRRCRCKMLVWCEKSHVCSSSCVGQPARSTSCKTDSRGTFK